MTHTITFARGDGIGPEIMGATLDILEAAKAPLKYDEIIIGKKVYEAGHKTGIPDEAWKSLEKTRVLLKAPITTPQGGGYKSLNVTFRKTLGLFANVRPCVSYGPYVDTKHLNMNVVIIRENEEDLYGGIEYRQSQDMTSAIKLISRPGCEHIIRYAFEYAKAYNRKHLTCMTKDNIMKISDGMFHKVFDEIAQEYPDISTDHYIIDIGAARLATVPHHFDMIVTPNLYGDVISDIAAEITGSVGLCGSANIGENCAMFEAIHGSAPDIAGQGVANPSGLIHGAIMMLAHIGELEIAQKIHNAWLKTIEDGIHTADIYKEGDSNKKVGTRDFKDAVIKRLGKIPDHLKAARYAQGSKGTISFHPLKEREHEEKKLTGMDIYVDWQQDIQTLVDDMRECLDGSLLNLEIITNRGVKVWPDMNAQTFCTDTYQCRLNVQNESSSQEIKHTDILKVLSRLVEKKIDFVRVENLYCFDGIQGYSSAQGG